MSHDITPDYYHWRIDAYESWRLAIAVKREQCVRGGFAKPINETEQRWAEEGPKPIDELETIIAEDRP